MRAIQSLIVVLALALVVYLGVGIADLRLVFGVFIPYAALLLFVCGFIYRVLKWARTPVPFRIPTTCGQQKTLPWLGSSPVDNPSNAFGVLVRMALEVLFFRSLFRNTQARIHDGGVVVHASNKLLWGAGLVFHGSFLVIVIRHFRFFIEPVPFPIRFVEQADGFFQVGLPIIYATDVALLLGLSYLFIRRVYFPQLRYISLVSDYFPLFLLLGIGLTGVWMRYFGKVDTVGVKELSAGLLSLRPSVPEGVGVFFYVHLFFVCVLLAYFPFSKLMHMGGVFLSPTRNLPNNTRMRRHLNPWDYPVKLHTYEEYEDEFREKMVDAGIPVDRELENTN